MRQIRFQFDGQPINETDTPAQSEPADEGTIDVFSSRQEKSTKKETCHFTPEPCCSNRPRIHSQLENWTLIPSHPDYYSVAFSTLSFSPFSIPLLYIK
jgi:hypothetical protein